MSDESAQAAGTHPWFTTMRGLVGAPPLSDDEAADVLDLARVVAHHTERPFAPLSAYLAGLALAGQGEAARRAQLRALIAALQDQRDTTERVGPAG